MSNNEDPLAPARGIVNGLLISAPIWGVILGLVWLVTRQ
jgi:hypothetical protein